MTSPAPEIRNWVRAHARPLALDVSGPPPAPPERLARARVVGIASAVRTARESIAATHVLLRALVERSGFRAVAVEGTDTTGAQLDRYVRTGTGDPAALLTASQSFLRVHEALTVVHWLRSWNTAHPDDPVSVVHDLAAVPPAGEGVGARARSRTSGASPAGGRSRTGTPPEEDELAAIEAGLARRDLDWLAATGQRIVHWGGLAHLVAGPPRTLPGLGTHHSAGGILRGTLGSGYAVAALTVGSGFVPFPLPPPARDFTEGVFAGIPYDAALLEVPGTPTGRSSGSAEGTAEDPGNVPATVTGWLARPLRTRVIGPVYDTKRNRDFRVDAGPVVDSVDVLAHIPRVLPVRPVGGRALEG